MIASVLMLSIHNNSHHLLCEIVCLDSISMEVECLLEKQQGIYSMLQAVSKRCTQAKQSIQHDNELTGHSTISSYSSVL